MSQHTTFAHFTLLKLPEKRCLGNQNTTPTNLELYENSTSFLQSGSFGNCLHRILLFVSNQQNQTVRQTYLFQLKTRENALILAPQVNNSRYKDR